MVPLSSFKDIKNINEFGTFDRTKLKFSENALNSVSRGRLKVNLHTLKASAENFELYCDADNGVFNIYAADSCNSVRVESGVTGIYDLRLWRNASITIGPRTTSNGTRIICDKSSFSCGADCMFSDGVLVQTADQHGIVDITTGKIINSAFKTVVLEDHVWLGRNSTITAGITLGKGCIVGTGAIVTKSIPEFSLAVGASRIIKHNVTWTRANDSLDEFSKNACEHIETTK